MQNEIGKKEILINIWIYSNFFPEFVRKIDTVQDKCARVALNDAEVFHKPLWKFGNTRVNVNWPLKLIPEFYIEPNNLNPLFMKEIFNCWQCIANDHCLCKSTVELTVCYYHVMLLSCRVGVSEWILHSVVTWMSRNSLLEIGAIFEV